MQDAWIKASEGLLSAKERSIEEYCIALLGPHLETTFQRSVYQYQNAFQTQDILRHASVHPLHLWVHANVSAKLLEALSTFPQGLIEFSFSSQRSLAEARRANKENAAHWLSVALERASFVPFPVDEGSPSLNRGRNDLVLGLFSGVGVEHHVHKVLEAVSQVGGCWGVRWMVQESERDEAVSLAREYPEVSISIDSPWSVEKFTEMSKEVSACAHLLFSAAETFSPCVPISLMQGLEVLVLNFSEGEMLPDAVVKKVLPGIDEISMIVSWLKNFQGEVCLEARNYAIELHSVQMVASNLSLELKR